MNIIAKGAYSTYDADKMHGLPVGVQVAGRRLEEEKVLEYTTGYLTAATTRRNWNKQGIRNGENFDSVR
jgi:Asp-tRNA(Asn)/Glu-tRNA(Gln) amidotransferase A subunit family amidase